MYVYFQQFNVFPLWYFFFLSSSLPLDTIQRITDHGDQIGIRVTTKMKKRVAEYDDDDACTRKKKDLKMWDLYWFSGEVFLD